jgi:L-lysine 6-monooxygenase (NADPH-requiring)
MQKIRSKISIESDDQRSDLRQARMPVGPPSFIIVQSPQKPPLTMANDSEVIYDVVGVGFGPANLAIAIALAERNQEAASRREITACFVESYERFSWYE